jgi:hypothetical protein
VERNRSFERLSRLGPVMYNQLLECLYLILMKMVSVFKALRYIYNLHLVTIDYRCKRMAPENIIPLWGVYIRSQTLADAKGNISRSLPHC